MTILQELYKLYERKGHEWPAEGYSESRVDFDVEIDLEGRLVTVTDNLQIKEEVNPKTGKTKKTKVKKTALVPTIPPRAGNAVTGFFFDKQEFLLGYHESISNLKYADAYYQKLQEIYEATGSPKVQAIMSFVDAIKAGALEEDHLLKPIFADPNSLLGIRIKGGFSLYLGGS